MLEGVRLNLETLGEQNAVIDNVMESVTRLTEMSYETQTNRALQTRRLAERIERRIKQLRKTASTEEKARPAGRRKGPIVLRF